jgi:membrane fusion protein, multidrug efflux system
VTTPRRKRLVRALLLGGAVVTMAATPRLYSLLLGSAAKPALAAAPPLAGSRSEAPVRVTAVIAEPAPLAEVVSSTGTLLAGEAVELQAEVSGKITRIDFTEGTLVRAGALLVKLNDADLQARRTAAQHELVLAERRAARAAELLAQGYIVPDDHDAAARTVNVRRAELDIIAAEIAKTEIRAPFDGSAGLRYVSTGALVGATTRIATLQRTDIVKIDFAISERHAPRVRIGSPISFMVAVRLEPFSGEVYAFDPRIDPETRTLLLRAVCPNPDGKLLPGAFANVRLTLAETADALLVPAETLVADFESAHVFVAADGVAVERRVVTGTRTERDVQIISGLAPGDFVITTGLHELRTGTPVEVELVSPAQRLLER